MRHRRPQDADRNLPVIRAQSFRRSIPCRAIALLLADTGIGEFLPTAVLPGSATPHYVPIAWSKNNESGHSLQQKRYTAHLRDRAPPIDLIPGEAMGPGKPLVDIGIVLRLRADPRGDALPGTLTLRCRIGLQRHAFLRTVVIDRRDVRRSLSTTAFISIIRQASATRSRSSELDLPRFSSIFGYSSRNFWTMTFRTVVGLVPFDNRYSRIQNPPGWRLNSRSSRNDLLNASH